MKLEGNTMITTVSDVIRTGYPDITIHELEKEQGFDTPCFFNLLHTVESSPKGEEKAERKYHFEVRFLPDVIEDDYMFHRMGNWLLENLQMVYLDEDISVSAEESRYEVSEGRLIFHITYRIRVIREKALKPAMETLIKTTRMKEV